MENKTQNKEMKASSAKPQKSEIFGSRKSQKDFLGKGKTDDKKEQSAIVRSLDSPVSTKYSIAICKFIRNKNPEEAISLLSQVMKKKKAVPMAGEIPHKKGMAGGRYPVRASSYFIKLLRNLVANASVKGLDINNLSITTAKTDLGTSTPRSGRRRREFKRTHITLIVEEKIQPIKSKDEPRKIEEKKEERKATETKVPVKEEDKK